MIRSVAELLNQLKETQAARLAEEAVRHAPTIGDMYEGLSSDLLSRSIPLGLELQVVTGFVTDDSGGVSGQIDCMLVRGEGRQIPYTHAFEWHVRDVVAVFEIKKTLYGAALADAFEHLGAVAGLASKHLASFAGDATGTVNPRVWRAVQRSFGQITGQAVLNFEDVQALRAEDLAIFNVLMIDAHSVLRVAFGYDGFRSERAFRDSLYDRLQEVIGVPGYGPGSFPHLIVSGDFSLVKANGEPYLAPRTDGLWPFYFSSSTNPLLLMLEIIWTRLVRDFGLQAPWGEDLEIEAIRPYLVARPEVVDGVAKGWHLGYLPLPEQTGEPGDEHEPWRPEPVSELQAVVLSLLGRGKRVSVRDPQLLALLADENTELDAFIDGLVGTCFVALRGEELVLLTENLAIAYLPDGTAVAGDNNTGRVERWVAAQRSAASRDSGEPD